MLSDGYLPFLLLLVIVLLLAKPATSDEGRSCKHFGQNPGQNIGNPRNVSVCVATSKF